MIFIIFNNMYTILLYIHNHDFNAFDTFFNPWKDPTVFGCSANLPKGVRVAFANELWGRFSLLTLFFLLEFFAGLSFFWLFSLHNSWNRWIDLSCSFLSFEAFFNFDLEPVLVLFKSEKVLHSSIFFFFWLKLISSFSVNLSLIILMYSWDFSFIF